MNERIRELIKEARYDSRNEKHHLERVHNREITLDEYQEIYDKRFAELIVKECIQTLRDNTPVVDEHDSVEDWDRGYIRGMVDCEHHIKEHFGVEE